MLKTCRRAVSTTAFCLLFVPAQALTAPESTPESKSKASIEPDKAQTKAADVAVEVIKRREEKEDGLNIYRHGPIYAVTGNPDTKIQFSFKIQIIANWELYFGYTQVMFWELGRKDSSPFSDLNYNPELFYRWYMNAGILKSVDLGFYEHLSNGRDGAASRSWQRSYVTARTEFPLGPFKGEWDTKVFHLYELDPFNDDIRDKAGFVETSFSISGLFKTLFDDAQLTFRWVPGGKLDFNDNQGSRSVDFRFRLPIKRFNPNLFVQVYDGFNESMLFYKSYQTSFRAGISL